MYYNTEIIINQSMAENVIFVQGPPGSGKSTLIREFLADHSHGGPEGRPLRYLPVGKHVRDVMAGAAFSRYAAAIQQAEGMIADMQLPNHLLVHSVVSEYIQGLEGDGTSFIDGFPREPTMIGLLKGSVKERVFDVLGSITLNVPDAVAVERQTSRVSVDSHPAYGLEMAWRRVREYRETTEPTARIARSIWGGVEIDNSGNFRDAYARFSTSALNMIRQAPPR